MSPLGFAGRERQNSQTRRQGRGECFVCLSFLGVYLKGDLTLGSCVAGNRSACFGSCMYVEEEEGGVVLPTDMFYVLPTDAFSLVLSR
jgi:hypothetical protein